MPWLIISNDNESGPSIRANTEIMDAHWAYEQANKRVILAAGSLREDDGETKNGSLLILNVSSREEAQRFFDNDPATQAGMRGDTQIRYINTAILNGEIQD